jgi:hypothetical protein
MSGVDPEPDPQALSKSTRPDSDFQFGRLNYRLDSFERRHLQGEKRIIVEPRVIFPVLLLEWCGKLPPVAVWFFAGAHRPRAVQVATALPCPDFIS